MQDEGVKLFLLRTGMVGNAVLHDACLRGWLDVLEKTCCV